MNSPFKSSSVLVFIFLAIAPTNLSAEDCKKMNLSDFPKSDLPTEADSKSLKTTESYKYYYGVGVPVDYVKARHLAFAELRSGDKEDFGGSGILVMVYANGYGVKKNLAISIRIACASNAAWAGKDCLESLRRLESGESKRSHFEICDSGQTYMVNFCSRINEERANHVRESRVEKIIKNWPQKDRSLFKKLITAREGFFRSRVQLEVDLSGTARAYFQNEEDGKLRDAFLNSLELFENWKFPSFNAKDFSEAEKELNNTYAIIRASKSLDYGTVEPEGIRETQ